MTRVGSQRHSKKKAHICLDICPLFFHVDTKLLKTLAIQYDEILEAL
jgi:hypothetical protein